MFDAPIESLQYQQVQRHEIARMQRLIMDLENHQRTRHEFAVRLGQFMQSEEQMLQYSQTLLDMNRTEHQLTQYRQALNELISHATASVSFGKAIPEQCRREIYHLYATGQYTQMQLATMYGISQAAVNKIVNDPPIDRVAGVNPSGVAHS